MSQTDTTCESYGRFHQVADWIGKRIKPWLALNYGGHTQAIGVGLVAFRICPFDSFMRSPRMSQTETTCESYGGFHQVADSIGKRRKTWLALNFGGQAQAIGDGLLSFEICPFDSCSKNVTNGHHMRKLWSFSSGGRFNRKKKEHMTCIELWRPRASCWSWTCVF